MLSFVDMLIGTSNYAFGSGLVSGTFSLIVLIPSIAVTVRRLHDINKSGWWFFIVLVPLLGMITLTVFACFDSDHNSNKYGPNPKYA